LRASYAFILKSTHWLGASSSFLSRVRDLHIVAPFEVDPLDPSDVTRVLRAAPLLKKFFTSHCVHGDASWLAPTAPTHPAFEGLVHPRLREFGIARDEDDEGTSTEATPPDTDLVAHLRRRHFPRLRELVVGDDACFVTPPPCFPLETGTSS
jgi:hypothetical protein